MSRTKPIRGSNKKPASRKIAAPEDAKVKFLMHHLSSPISIYDSKKERYIYVNPHFCHLTGLTEEELHNIKLTEFLTRVHAKDLLVVLNAVAKQVRNACVEYIEKKNCQVVYTLNYRLKQADGTYLHVMAQNTVLEWYKDVQRSVVLSLYTDISNHKKDHKIMLTLNAMNPADKLWKTVLTEEFLTAPEMLSRREKEVMMLIVQENTASQVAQKLGLKFYTVRAHWRNILGKTGCKSHKELKALAHKEGWI